MNTVSITIDVEDWYHIPSVTGSPFSVYKDVPEFFDKWKGRYDYLSLREPTKRVLDMLDEFDIKATFFVVADVVEHYPGLVESIQSYLQIHYIIKQIRLWKGFHLILIILRRMGWK